MKLFQKFNSDKKFRKNVFIGLIIGLFLLNINQQAPEQALFPSQATCDTCGEGALNLCDIDECISDLGCVWRVDSLLTASCRAGLDEQDYTCSFWTHVTDYPSVYPDNMCKEGLVPTKQKTPSTVCTSGGNIEYRCLTQEEIDDNPDKYDQITQCSSWQKPFAKILDGIWKNNDIDSCPTKAYMVIGFTVFGLLAVI